MKTRARDLGDLRRRQRPVEAEKPGGAHASLLPVAPGRGRDEKRKENAGRPEAIPASSTKTIPEQRVSPLGDRKF
ncbi:hypothetical protein A1351_14130 [Methylosinus sp. R-45379]|nr:hypothetical protein A1351_14130 [Methylosinus sp. R-45379]